MKIHLLPCWLVSLLVLVVLKSGAMAQFTGLAKPMEGTFFVSVDDAATIYINGEECYSAKIGESQSGPLKLRIGDRVVAALRNDGDQRFFKLMFASKDGKSIVSFKHTDFKTMTPPDTKDFAPGQYKTLPKTVKVSKPRPDEISHHEFSQKNRSEWIWGDLDTCYIGCVVTSQMISGK